jgi:hypothetical protein
MLNERFRMMRLLSPPDEGGGGGTGSDDAAAATAAAAVASTEAASAPAAAVDAAAAATSLPAADAARAPAADAPSATSLIGDADAKSKDAAAAPAETKAPDAAAEPKAPDAEAGKDAKTEAKPEGDKPKEEPKKDDGKDAAKDPEAAVVESPAAVALTLADLTLPDNIKLADKESKAFLDVLNDPKLEPKARAQGLIDLYLGEMSRIAQEADQRQRTAWDNYNVQRKSEVKADPEVGGNRMNTALSMAKAVIEEYGGSQEQRAELYRRLDEKSGTGMGNDVFLIRLLNNIGRKLNVYEDGIIPANPSPPKPSRTPGKRGWYDDSRTSA